MPIVDQKHYFENPGAQLSSEHLLAENLKKFQN
jgi:hypothetical protein